MEAGQGVFHLALAALGGPRHGERPIAPAVGHGHAPEPAGPFAVHAHGTREHVPVQGEVAVAPVKPRAREPAPGRQPRAGPGGLGAEVQPEGTP